MIRPDVGTADGLMLEALKPRLHQNIHPLLRARPAEAKGGLSLIPAEETMEKWLGPLGLDPVMANQLPVARKGRQKGPQEGRGRP